MVRLVSGTDRVKTEREKGRTLRRSCGSIDDYVHRERRIQAGRRVLPLVLKQIDSDHEPTLMPLLTPLCDVRISASVERLDSDLGHIPKHVEHPL